MSTRYTREELDAARRAFEETRAALIEEGTCPECGGDGEYPGPTPSHWGEPKYYRCDECHGSGKYTEVDD